MLYVQNDNNTNTTVHVTAHQRNKSETADTFNTNKVWYLIKLTNDTSGKVSYFYPEDLTHIGNSKGTYRYSSFLVRNSTTATIYNKKVDLTQSGYYSYKIYEVAYPVGIDVSYAGAPFNVFQAGYTPINENNDYEAPSGAVGSPPASDYRGEVVVCLEEGKLLSEDVSERANNKYTNYTTQETNYIYTE